MQFSGVTFSGGGFTVTPPPVTPPPLGPAAPTGLSATIGNTQLSIAFTPGSDNGNPITNYKYSLDGINYTALSPADTTSPVTITGLTNGTAYTVYLKAVNAVGDSPASASTSGTPATTPAAPTGLSATAGDTQLSIAFTPGSNGGNAITNYKYSLDGINYTALSPADSTSPVVITGLTNGVTYTVYLKAVNAVGDSPASASTSGTPAFNSLLFSDNFSTGNFSKTENGVSWTGSDVDVTVQSGRGVAGSNSAQFRFIGTPPGGDAGAERRFDLGALYTEITIKFDLYIPDGFESWGGAAYAHRNDSPSNNKFFRLWPINYNDRTKVGASLWRSGTSPAISSIRSDWSVAYGGLGPNGQTYTTIISESDRGTWMEIEIYCKAPTATANGTMIIYKNGTPIISNIDTMNSYHSDWPPGWRYGYLLGWANSGFDNDTYLQIDNVEIFTGPAFIPESEENFNQYSNGTSLDNVYFTDAGRTVADTSTRYESSGASAKMSIRTVDVSGFGNWGGIYTLSTPLVRGDEIWVRWRQYWPSSFVFSATPAMKFLRLWMSQNVGSMTNAGYMDLYINDEPNWSSWVYGTIREFSNNNIWAYTAETTIPRDQWVTYEIYCKLDVKAADGGSGVLWRFWINGQLVQERDASSTGTMDNVSNVLRKIYWFTYWNNENPPNNDTYVDDIIIATSDSPPYDTDSNGNKFIGLWTPP